MHAIGWQEIALRLCLTVIAGFLVGLERGKYNRPAGMRTTLLVCLAASISMIQANLLLVSVGRAPDSFVRMDIMRLPLGILTGVGFIGAGAIFRRNDLVHGITTAATLWFVTVIGLCFGGGQIWLGVTGTTMALVVLSGLRVIELRIPQERTAMLTIRASADGPTSEQLCRRLGDADLHVTKLRETYVNGDSSTRTMRFHLRWRGFREDATIPPVIGEMAGLAGVRELEWNP